MNYFLLNNNFHYSYLEKYFNENILNESVFIVVIHRFNAKLLENKKVIYIQSPINTIRDIYKIFEFSKVLNQIDTQLNLNFETDTLFVMSEQDFINAYIINFFKLNKSVIYLLEDGTFTPVFLSITKNCLKINFLFFYIYYTFFFLFIKYFFKLKYLKIKFIYNMPAIYNLDSIYRKIYISSNYNPERNIPKEFILPIYSNKISASNNFLYENGVAVFANSPHYLDIGNKYYKILESALKYITIEYELKKIIFCFHPSEDKKSINLIKNKFLDKNISFSEYISTKECIQTIKPEYLFSFMSTTIIELGIYSRHSIFLIEKYPEIMFPKVSIKMINYIKSLI
jgi:hypothetical protein